MRADERIGGIGRSTPPPLKSLGASAACAHYIHVFPKIQYCLKGCDGKINNTHTMRKYLKIWFQKQTRRSTQNE